MYAAAHPPALFVLSVGHLEKAVEDDDQWELELFKCSHS